MVWVNPDYSQASDEEVLIEYELLLYEIQKRFTKKKIKKK